MKIGYNEYKEVNLSTEQIESVAKHYLNRLIGVDCYITKEGKLEHWTSYPHGSGTTTELGEPTELQIAADKVLKLL